jgi:hypothetical protein
MDWFEKLTGFRETDYDVTRSRLEVVGSRLHSNANGQSYGIGILETPPLKELRQMAQAAVVNLPGSVKVSCVSGDVRALYRDPANANALFQVASQFNFLEMTGPDVTHEQGVTRYASDRTQGPACAILSQDQFGMELERPESRELR